MFYNKTHADMSREQNKAWVEARYFFGSATALVEAVNKELKPWEEPLKPVTVNAWISQWRSPPHEYAVVVSRLTGISLERLSPFTTSANGDNRSKKIEKRTLIQWLTQQIDVPSDFHDPMTTVGPWIIVGSDGVLISGSATLQWYRDQGKERIPAITVDLRGINPEGPFLETFDVTFSISQRSSISAAVKKTWPKRQGTRSELIAKPLEAKKDENGSSLRSLGYEVKGRTDELLAKLFGFTSKELWVRAQKIYNHAPESLILAVDEKKMPITVAARMLKKPEDLQAFEQAQASGNACKVLKNPQKKGVS